MAQILVRNLDEAVVESLKKRALKDGRSLQAELKIILEQAAHQTTIDMQTARKISEEFHKTFKGRKFPDTVKLIREDRKR